MGSDDGTDAGRLPQLLRDLRRRAGLTQRETASLAGVSVAALRDLEQGRVTSPRPATLRKLASAMSLTEAQAQDLVRAAAPPGRGVRVRILGTLTVSVDGAVVDLGSATRRTLLGLLALSANSPVSRDALVDAAWGRSPAARSVDLLQTHVSRVRRRLQPATARDAARPHRLLKATVGGYQLTLTADQLDSLQFAELLEQARDARSAGDPQGAAKALDRALRLWRDIPLRDLPTLHSHPRVVRLVRMWQAAVVDYAAACEGLGRHDLSLPYLQQLTDAEPLHEAAHAHLMQALAASGQTATALTSFDTVRRRLADELGTDPSPGLAAAHQRILRHEGTPDRTETAPVTAWRQLPPDIADFVGRTSELARLHGAIPSADGDTTAVVISSIEGMAGVGKTRLAVHLAHQLVAAGRYADVQLYVDLHGHASQPPADPSSVLASFLHLLGVPGSRIPHDLDARTALFRDQLHGRHAVVLLDNAHDEEQVHPLLPASPTNLVLVTSRRTLALDGATPLPLDAFTRAEAEQLLARIAGADRVTSDADATAHLIDLCGRLPLAIALAARRLQTRPVWRVTDLVHRLEHTTDRVGELTAGSRHLRPIFDLSYDALPAELAATFLHLGLHPGDDFTPASTSALTGYPLPPTRRLLDQLVDEHLLTMTTSDRYRLHDLLKEYANHRLRQENGVEHAAEASHRLLTWYLYAADAACHTLFPFLPEVELDAADHPGELPAFADEEEAFRWLTAEHANLIAAAAAALDQRLYDVAWQLPGVLKHYYERQSPFDDWLEAGTIALTAARRAGNRDGEASALGCLGLAHGQLDDIETSVDHLRQALRIRHELTGRSSRESETRLLNNLGVAYGNQGRLDEALASLHEALRLSRDLGLRYLETRVLSNLGVTHTRLGQHAEAIRALREVLDISQRENDPVGTAGALQNLGEALLSDGRVDEAVGHLNQAMQLYRRKHFRLYEAETLCGLGDAHERTGDTAEALGCWRRALTILDELGHPMADDVRIRVSRVQP